MKGLDLIKSYFLVLILKITTRVHFQSFKSSLTHHSFHIETFYYFNNVQGNLKPC